MPELMYDKILIENDVFIPFISEDKLQERIKQLAQEISRDYEGKTPVFIGILNGAFLFLADLVKYVSINCEIDFLKLSSYGDAKISSGKVTMLKELNCDVDGRDIIIVEDIVDSGLSIKFIEEHIARYNPASLKVVSLLVKPKSLKFNIKIDYIGFDIPDKFVIGFGLDYAQKYRNLRSIYVLEDNLK